MNVSKNNLAGKFRKENRYNNFGECVNAVSVHEVRGLSCKVEFEYPVTAITGLNGVGKTTLGQLLLCAYRSLPQHTITRHLLGSYFRGSSKYTNPFTNNSYVKYHYQASDQKSDNIVSINREPSGWKNYKFQPERAAILIDPKINLHDDVREHMLQFEGPCRKHEVEGTSMWLSRIFNSEYSEACFDDLGLDGKFLVMQKYNITYSKENMGFGEYRTINIIRFLERCPEKSFVFLDEPDIGLHAYAQHKLVNYLIDVSYRRGHQVVFTTHSSEMVETLPPEGRIMLERDLDSVSVHNRISSTHIRNALSLGSHGFLVVCVEDEFAKILFEEIMIMTKKKLCSRIKVLPYGDHEAVKKAVFILHKAGVSAIGVLDGDQRGRKDDRIYTLPGDRIPPEKLVFNSISVKNMLLKKYKFDFNQYLTAYPNADHHNYSRDIERQTNIDHYRICIESVQEFVASKSKKWSEELVKDVANNA